MAIFMGMACQKIDSNEKNCGGQSTDFQAQSEELPLIQIQCHAEQQFPVTPRDCAFKRMLVVRAL